jgi:hypothetical protein
MKSTVSKIIIAGLFSAVVVSSAVFAMPGDDRPREINAGMQKIDAAAANIRAAGDSWNGHRDAALRDLQAARHELELAQQSYGKR